MADLEEPPAEFATASTRIIVARHAERADDVDVGWTAHDDGFPDDPPLTPFGLEQAALLAQTLLRARPNLDAVCTSPFLRCVQTADAVARAFGLPLRVEHGLYEHLAPGSRFWGGGGLKAAPKLRSPAELRARFPSIDASHRSLARPEYPEDGVAVRRRHVALARRCLRRFAGRQVLLVGHGATVRFLALALRAPAFGVPRFCVPYASCAEFLVPPAAGGGAAAVLRYADARHLAALRHDGRMAGQRGWCACAHRAVARLVVALVVVACCLAARAREAAARGAAAADPSADDGGDDDGGEELALLSRREASTEGEGSPALRHSLLGNGVLSPATPAEGGGTDDEEGDERLLGEGAALTAPRDGGGGGGGLLARALANEAKAAVCAAKERLGEHCFSADADEAWDGALGAIGRN